MVSFLLDNFCTSIVSNRRRTVRALKCLPFDSVSSDDNISLDLVRSFLHYRNKFRSSTAVDAPLRSGPGAFERSKLFLSFFDTL